MRLTPTILLYATVLLLACAPRASAQNFFGGGGNAFDPEISIVNSGAILDAQATVSADRKYVTMTLRPQVSQLVALRDFTFQTAGGFVGGSQPGTQQPPAGGNPIAAPPATGAGNAPAARPATVTNRRTGPLMPAGAPPAAKPAGVPVLHQPGMHRVDRPAAVPAPASSAKGE